MAGENEMVPLQTPCNCGFFFCCTGFDAILMCFKEGWILPIMPGKKVLQIMTKCLHNGALNVMFNLFVTKKLLRLCGQPCGAYQGPPFSTSKALTRNLKLKEWNF